MSNIEKFLNRTSVRDFDKNYKMPKEDLETLVKIINNSPTSTNGQQFSAIIFSKQEDKDWFSQKNWGQKHIAEGTIFILFVADRYRNISFIKEYASDAVAEFEIFRGIVDATIAATYAQDALITMGYGTTLIGGVIGFAKDIEKKYDLPKDTQVVVGLSVGKKIKDVPFKPKMNKVFFDKYNSKKSIKNIEEYNLVMRNYYKTRGEESDFKIKQKQMVGKENPYNANGPFAQGANYIKEKIKINKNKKI